MISGPTVTIGLPIHREPIDQLRSAITSVINQTFSDWELLIVADGAPKATLSFLSTWQDSRIRVIAHERAAGLPVRLNEIARFARGSYLARFDADDIMLPDRIQHQLRVLHESGADLIAGRAVIIDEKNRILAESPIVEGDVTPESTLRATPFIHPTVFARTSWFQTHRYDESLLRSQDKALWLTGFADSRYWRDPHPVIFYRVSTQLDPKKYARTAAFERKIIRRDGPRTIGSLRTFGLLMRSTSKQAFVEFAAFIGRPELVLSRRYRQVDQATRERWSAALNGCIAPANAPTSKRETE